MTPTTKDAERCGRTASEASEVSHQRVFQPEVWLVWLGRLAGFVARFWFQWTNCLKALFERRKTIAMSLKVKKTSQTSIGIGIFGIGCVSRKSCCLGRCEDRVFGPMEV